MNETIIDIISKVTKIEKEALSHDLTKEDIWDSFTLVEIIFALEEKFDIVFDEDDFSQIKNVQIIIEFVKRKASDET